MPELNVRGIPIQFPFEPYACQVEYQQRVIASLQEHENALLESPTGTGKTLCLLTSTLAWLQSYKAVQQLHGRLSYHELEETEHRQELCKDLVEAVSRRPDRENFVSDKPPKIYYASRTHSQLSQVIQELKRTAYNNVKICVLGSREQMCVEESVQRLPSNAARQQVCRSMVNENRCGYHAQVKSVRVQTDAAAEIMDIEELVHFGKVRNACPYYLTREQMRDADIVFLPYNYLVDRQSRESQKVDVRNAILIFDEAHNLENSCGEATSFDITPNDLLGCLAEVDTCREMMTRPEYYRTSHDPADFDILKVVLVKFQEALQEINIGGPDKSFDGTYAFEFFGMAGVSRKNMNKLVSSSEAVVALLSQETEFTKKKLSINVWLAAIRTIFTEENLANKEAFRNSYKVCITEEVPAKKPQKSLWTSAPAAAGGRTFSLWCFSSGVAMKSLVDDGCRSIILTSGTLSPLDSFATELRIPFKYTLENPHVIDASQMVVGIVPRGPSGIPLNSAFKNRESESYRADLGNTLANLARIVPDGLLVFFPSYGAMEQCIQFWKASASNGRTIWDRIKTYKEPFVEPKDKVDFGKAMETFYQKAQDATLIGAIFFAVCRGKASEGIDFSGSRARAVVITGLPFPAFKDPKVALKRQFLDGICAEEKRKQSNVVALSGNAWYEQQAARAVNQAIGRAIRHRNDWGAVLLCDDRFAQPKNRRLLPKWVQPFVKEYNSFGEVQWGLTQFFRHRATVDASNAHKEDVKREAPPIRNADKGAVKIEYEKEKKPSGVTVGGTTGFNMPGLSLWEAPMAAANMKQKDKPVKSLNSFLNQTSDLEFRQGTAQEPKCTPISATPAVNPPPLPTSSTRINTTVLAERNWSQDLGGPPKREKPIATPMPSSIAPMTKRTKEEAAADAADYYASIQAKLSRDDFRTFKSMLKKFKCKELTLEELMKRWEILFGKQDRYELFRGFQAFLPSKQQSEYAKRVVLFGTIMEK